MTLREELPQRTQEPVFSRINHELHEEIRSQVEEYLRKGGKVNVIPQGASSEIDVPMIERNAIDRKKKLAIDRVLLKEHHEKGEMLNIKYMPKTKSRDACFRYSHHAKVMGYFPTLAEAAAFRVKA